MSGMEVGMHGDGGVGGGGRQLSTHSTGTSGLTVSLRDGSVTLANTWSRQLSEDTTGTVSWVTGLLGWVCEGNLWHPGRAAGRGLYTGWVCLVALDELER